ncbi:N-6 DNA methylase [Thermosulfuriphilus ammonigenes]|uniref:site-specific DNA-methyltransferase (adenine-specific) n=1 Tax=Thermosulfuriphilus ammonigenes TaxID=1936021 RepID=A0A6G7PUD0_9BACT|nr:N-6 DNA methylase [Thermosulfuriphilus ammonigenes]MBA2848699.1 hypothetical protein [Thermosulfuriphilus ammonigenes]QIJ71166.1 N-6 DNA methylase [Thermosulfuriphilus ammonigenes]
MKIFPAVRMEGGLFAPDLFERVINQDLPGQKPADFGLSSRQDLINEIAAVFADARSLWEIFKHRLERLPKEARGERLPRLTREYLAIPLLGLLGYELYSNHPHYYKYKEGGLTFRISHRAGEDLYAPPVHIVSFEQPLGQLAERSRFSPHSLVQEFLNRTEALWGLVTNGRVIRLLRDSTYLRRQCYLEFDLEAIFEQHLFEDFLLLFRLLHRSRLPRGAEDASQCLLEQYYQLSLEEGERARDRLRDSVVSCLTELAQGFLSHPENNRLRERLSSPDDSYNALAFYRDLLRLIYRFLFLLVAEDRGLLSDDPLYREHYSVSRFRRLVENRSFYTEHEDLWLSLRVLWKLLSDATPKAGGRPLASYLGLSPLNGELFSPLFLDECLIRNRELLSALWWLLNYRESGADLPHRINYAALDVEELGSVYESLLDYQPTVTKKEGQVLTFELNPGTERKSTGSYYTPAPLVAELIRSALEPVIKERLKEAKRIANGEWRTANYSLFAAKAILGLRIIDPACGSGHFLLAAARRLGKELARIETGEDEPSPEAVRKAVREVIAHCIYGVDKNPLAVELCRVALWIEAHVPGKPLTFLDHHIKCGDSLVGVFDLNVLTQGIPDEAFKPLEGDERSVCQELRNTNRRARRRLFGESLFNPRGEIEKLAEEFRKVDELAEDTVEALHEKTARWQALRRKPEWEKLKRACDLWTSAFFMPKTQKTTSLVPTSHDLYGLLANPGALSPQKLAQAEALAEKHRFFHWPLEFPEVFARGGFDVVLGNPPWEMMQLEEVQFFATRAPEIAQTRNSAERKKLINKLKETNPALYEEYLKAKHYQAAINHYIRKSGRFPLTAYGKLNTYSVFAELALRLTCPAGRAGIIVPTGIATDDTNKHFFSHLMENGLLASLYDFQNRERLFPAVTTQQKFSLLTLHHSSFLPSPSGRGVGGEGPSPKFVFFAIRVEHLRDPRRSFTLTAEDIARINPNTRTTPVFRTSYDAELTKKIYRVPVLVNEKTDENPWGVSFKQGLFNMSSDSHLFRTREQLQAAGYELKGNIFVKANSERRTGNRPLATHHSPLAEIYLPLYEAKMIWQFDHRFGSYEGLERRSHQLFHPDPRHKRIFDFVVQSWYWVPAGEVLQHLENKRNLGWLIGFRDVARATDERTAIFSLLPKVGVGHTMPLIFLSPQSVFIACILANFNSLVFDFCVRQKLGGTHLTYHYLKQLPILPPEIYTTRHLLFAIPRILELTYTAWDLKPFADDLWAEADEDLRSAIRKQWEENQRIANGEQGIANGEQGTGPKDRNHSPLAIRHSPPEWLEIIYSLNPDHPNKDACPLPPFKWDESRRARLRAELDAFFAKLYGLTEEELRYILDPQDVFGPSFPGETFRVLKEKEIRQFGEYRTKHLILEAWERLFKDQGGKWEGCLNERRI